MRIRLSGIGLESQVQLFDLQVDEDGRWIYETRAIDEVRGELPPENLEQFRGYVERVDWNRTNLNHHITHEDRTKFRLTVELDQGALRTYQFSEAMRGCGQEFRDLVHFLRHNVVHPVVPAYMGHADAGAGISPPL